MEPRNGEDLNFLIGNMVMIWSDHIGNNVQVRKRTG